MQIRHPFIVRFYESFVEDEYFCLGSPVTPMPPKSKKPGRTATAAQRNRSQRLSAPAAAFIAVLARELLLQLRVATSRERSFALQSLSIAAAVTCVPKSSRRRNGRCAAHRLPQRHRTLEHTHYSSAASVTGAVWCERIPARLALVAVHAASSHLRAVNPT